MRSDEQWYKRMLYVGMLLLFSGFLVAIAVGAIEVVMTNI